MFTSAKSDTANLREDTSAAIKNTKEDLKDGVHNLKTDVREAANAVRGDLNDVARQAGRHVRGIADNAEQQLTEKAGAVTAKIRENPVQSSLVALGVGFVLGSILMRK